MSIDDVRCQARSLSVIRMVINSQLDGGPANDSINILKGGVANARRLFFSISRLLKMVDQQGRSR